MNAFCFVHSSVTQLKIHVAVKKLGVDMHKKNKTNKQTKEQKQTNKQQRDLKTANISYFYFYILFYFISILGIFLI